MPAVKTRDLNIAIELLLLYLSYGSLELLKLQRLMFGEDCVVMETLRQRSQVSCSSLYTPRITFQNTLHLAWESQRLRPKPFLLAAG